MSDSGWKSLLSAAPSFRGEGAYPIPAYSEFMPAPRLVLSPYGAEGPSPFLDADPWGWHISEHEEALELQPGLEQIAAQLGLTIARLGRGARDHGISRAKRTDNPYWPSHLAKRAGSLEHERYVILAPVALSRTQDDKGRVRWTLFGGSEQGPARPFWRSFFRGPGQEHPPEVGLRFIHNLLVTVYGAPLSGIGELDRAGFRILPQGDNASARPFGSEGPLPSWTAPFLRRPGSSLRGVRYLLTFEPFATLPRSVQRAYFDGHLHLLPCPGSLLFWGAPPYCRLQGELPFALQIPLLSTIRRHEGAHGVRVPQTGWLHEPRDDQPHPGEHHGPVLNTFRRTHRNQRLLRNALESHLVTDREDRIAHVLFDSSEAIGLYGKPMARNVQLWTEDFQLLLDGPSADRARIEHAAEAVRHGGLFGYRFQFPPMRIGRHELYWHRILAGYVPLGSDQTRLLDDAPLGYLTAYPADAPDPARPTELWPRIHRREARAAAIHLFSSTHDRLPHQTQENCRKLLDASEALGAPLPHSFARALLTLPKHETLDNWLQTLHQRSGDATEGRRLAASLRDCLASDGGNPDDQESHTLERTARRSFETAYWKAIREISAEGRFANRNNADCACDPASRAALRHLTRDLDHLGDTLTSYHDRAIAAANMTGRAYLADLPFHWRTDFDFAWSDGWRANQGTEPRERDLTVVIPGRDRSRAVIMADHYDTAYMEDRYKTADGKPGPRLATPGSDDNTSATAALLMAAPVFLELSREGRLGCDVWLVHLTGEEFPSDCLGARHMAQSLVQGTLRARRSGGRWRDLSRVRVDGVFVLDMVAHDNPRNRGVFQIAPGASRESLELALEAHRATLAWNARIPVLNRHLARRKKPRTTRSGNTIPPTARHPEMYGEVRPHDDPPSTLFNTDGQIFSDAGIPVVLFMEDYDIDRSGYHDSHDTMAGIDLDYGAALVAIAIESVARTANRGPATIRPNGPAQ